MVVFAPSQITPAARDALNEATTVCVGPVSLFEIAQKVRIGKWPDVVLLAGRLIEALEEHGGKVLELGARICSSAGELKWSHRDPFDRLIAASALSRSLPLISSDAVCDGLMNRIGEPKPRFGRELPDASG